MHAVIKLLSCTEVAFVEQPHLDFIDEDGGTGMLCATIHSRIQQLRVPLTLTFQFDPTEGLPAASESQSCMHNMF